MLQSTFCHIPGVGYATEQRLWHQGITSWERLLETPDIIPRVSDHEVSRILKESLQALTEGPGFFSQHLKSRDSWRLFPHFRDKTAYLDIETTGLGDDAEITTIALYDGKKVYTYVNGQNLDTFINDIRKFNLLVTYNGISFDIPFIERFFRTTITQAQIDLRYILAQLGFRGGLKGCEKQLGIDRGTLDGLDGAFAVILWHEYERYNNKAALETLLAYNVEDTVNLERLAVEAYNINVGQILFASNLLLPFPDPPKPPFKPDPEIVAKSRNYFR